MFLQKEDEASQPLPLQRMGPGWRAAQKGLGKSWILGSPFSNPAAGQGCWPRLLPAPKDTGVSPGLTWGSSETPRARELAPCVPCQHPRRRLFRKVLAVPARGAVLGLLCRELRAGRGTEGPQQGTRGRSHEQKPGRGLTGGRGHMPPRPTRCPAPGSSRPARPWPAAPPPPPG